jgi:hypothetical protein
VTARADILIQPSSFSFGSVISPGAKATWMVPPAMSRSVFGSRSNAS